MIRRRSIQTIFSAAVMLAAATPAWAEGVLVFGGTGLLGSEIVKQLANAGETQITVFARPTSDRSRLDGIDVNYVVGDVLNESRLWNGELDILSGRLGVHGQMG